MEKKRNTGCCLEAHTQIVKSIRRFGKSTFTKRLLKAEVIFKITCMVSVHTFANLFL